MLGMHVALLLTLLAAAPAKAVGAPTLRPRPYDVEHYRVELRLSEDGTFDGQVDIRLTPRRALSTLELDSAGLDVTAVERAGGGAVRFTLADEPSAPTGVLTVRPAQPLAGNKETTLRVR